MGNFLNESDLKTASRIGKFILIIFACIYLLLASLMFVTGNEYPGCVNIFLALIYLYTFKKILKEELNSMVLAVHSVCVIYAVFMVLYFGWNFGAQYFIIPCIAFCYVGQYESRKTIYLVALIEAIIFELLYFFMEVQGYSLNNKLIIFGKDYNGIFYIIHSLLACITIIVVMYFLKVKINKTIEDKENLNEALSINASTDPLTYLLNRWAFMEKIRLLDYKKPFHFAIIDIDYFKKINDNYGHSVGDEVLKVTASIIKDSFSYYTDMIARWGGEEFLVFAASCSDTEFYEACSNFRKELKNTNFCANSFNVTASIGCLHINKDFTYNNFDNYIKEVDELLYKAKNTGRNRIETNSWLILKK